MIKGIGIDIVEIDRITSSILKWGDKFLKKIFNDHEISLCYKKKNTFQCLAARFAAKEAFIKALSDSGAEGRMPGLKDITVMNYASGKPFIFSPKDLTECYVINLTISHERHYTVAMVILESKEI